MDRGRKRPETSDPLPADKRACSSSSRPEPEPAAVMDCDSASASSGRSDPNGYGSCEESDPDPPDYPHPTRYGSSRSKLQKIVASLGDDADPITMLAFLTELCEALSFCMEESLLGFPMDKAVPLLVKLANYEGSPDIMLLAVRSLTYLCDVMPRSADWLVKHGAVPVLCGKLLAIDYLDVAEQCLQTLEKISKRQPVPCLQAGTIMAVLSYIDFFSTSVQRVALSTVANVCKNMPLDCSSLVMESVPTLCNLLQYEDRKLVETAATCLIRITESFSMSSVLLDELCSHGLINKLLHLVAVDGHLSISQTTYVGLIGLLTKLAAKSLSAVRTLFEMKISSILKGILLASDSQHAQFQDSQSNQVHEVLKLLNQLIPSASRDAEDIQLVLAKEKVIDDEPKYLHQFSADILPASIQLVNSDASLHVCYCCVSIINNIVYFSKPDMLSDLLKHTNISSFLAGMLARKHQHVQFPTLKIVENLMQKLPGVFTRSFIKEGVIYAIDALLILNSCSQSLSRNEVTARDHTSRCLCYAFDSSHSSAETKACRVGKDAVLNLAEQIKATYFRNGSVDCGMGLTEILQKLKTYCGELNDNGAKYLTNDVAAKEDYLSDVLGQVLRELNGGDSLSTFEFMESGIVKSLAHYLCNGRYLRKTLHSHNSSDNSLAVLTRFQTFAAISLSNSALNWKDMLLTSLVRKLQSALSSSDTFPVILSHTSKPRIVLADIPVRHSTMHPCLKVRFMREEGEESICESNDVSTVELSSSWDVIERYLWPKVSRNKEQQQAEPLKEDTKAVEFYSESKNADGIDSQEQHAVKDPPVSMLPEVVNIQERQNLLVDFSTKLRNLMTEPSYSCQEPIEESTSSSSRSEVENPKLIFAFEGKQPDRSTTLYQAILGSKINAEADIIVGPKFWNEVYKVTYKRAEPNVTCSQSSDTSESSHFWDKIGFSWHKLSFFSSLLVAELPCKLDKSNPSYDILFMMKLLEGLNRNSFQMLSNDKSAAFAQGRIENFDDLKVVVSAIPQTEFISTKLTDKLEQQLRDPLVSTTGSMPLWCSELMAVCSFLFSFETRWKYFRMTAFGSSKVQHPALLRSNNRDTSSNIEQQSPPGLSYRKKFKVDRSSILESATKMMSSLACSKAVIEVEYNDEVGTGLGPTMEFYTLVSREFQKNGLGLWRDDTGFINSGGSEFVLAPFGLFPRPWSVQISPLSETQFSDVIRKFFLLGQLVAKAIKDRRILDIPFSRAFYKVILEQELGIYDIQSFDPELGRTLLEFQALVDRKKYLEAISRGNQRVTSNLCFRKTRIEDLCLDFTLPGYSDYILSGGSSPKPVNIDNLEQYVKLVVNATIKDGISRQVNAFKSGFNEVCPLKDLHIFTEDELERLLCGDRDTWDFSQLLDHVKFDHGYTVSSTSISNLLEIIHEFGCDERRAFLQFVTGAPRLPPGGLAALNPKLTIVRKHCCNNPDMDLPSVMTCANYLKLPSYSSKERMRERLLYAITEGQGSFHLS